MELWINGETIQEAIASPLQQQANIVSSWIDIGLTLAQCQIFQMLPLPCWVDIESM